MSIDDDIPAGGSDLPPAPEDNGGLDLCAVLEAALFASPEPLGLDEMQAALPKLSAAEIDAGLSALERALARADRGLKLERIAGGYRLITRPELAEPLRALFRFRNQRRLTPATLDVLAIVAYAQPITAPEIHEIRGTDPAHALRVLLERRFIRMVGRKRVVGRPILYGTTRDFLLHFGLDSLEDLPPVEAYGTRVVPAQGRLFPVTAFPDEAIDPAPGEAGDAAEEAGEAEFGGAGEDVAPAEPPAAPPPAD
ncbi:MAG: SMC-Scp complex subunit ScpB [Acidobacteria bacterium]|nr:SMC-Scp complex subunit ScpB [Acidobacteriota bacterium]